ncbi:thiopurine S-methyltransferase [Pseudomonas sp.]|uniref:thiopurine S-methyltransferase n=1 Tax=Pseudomonas sp. TaxID=306 RepID=UPI003CC5E8A4
MQADFWRERWQRNQIGFHQAAVNPYLQRHWPLLAQHARVLVPLCGKSLDLAWLAGRGMRVLGVELAPQAVEAFFAEQGLQPEIVRRGDFTCYSAGDLELWCGDFFALNADDVAGCTAFYDRAALIALPPEMRERYVQHLAAILPAGCVGLLVTLDYDQDVLPGPPFSVPDQEVRALWGAGWQVEEVECRDILDKGGKFVSAGAKRLHERAYRLKR